MKVFLHIGLHRTASTFFQTVYFPQIEKQNLNVIFNETKILKILRDEYIEKIINKDEINPKDIKKKIDDEISSIQNDQKKNLNELVLIFSDENLIPDKLFEKNEPQLFEHLSMLNKFFKDPEIILIIREHSSFIKSVYSQHVREGKYIYINDFINSYQSPNIDISKLNYHKIIDYISFNFANRFYLFKHENFYNNLSYLNKIFKTKIDVNSISQKKINKSISYKQILFLVNLEKKFKISKIENFLSFFLKLINKKVESLPFKSEQENYNKIVFFLLKVYNYIIKLIGNFKFSKITFFIKDEENFNAINNINLNFNYKFENYENLNKYLFKKNE